jgi:hypothetical protein
MKGRWALAACAPLAALAFAGAARAQEQVHVDGSVVVYDGANQRMSKGAHPFGRLVSGGQPKSHSHGHGTPTPPPELAQAIRESADRHQLDAHLVEAVAWQESHYKSSARSAKGAQGTMQLMPATARAVGVDPTDDHANIEGGVIYLASMMNRFGGDKEKALAAYNAGPGAVARYGGVPPYRETKAYVSSIMGRLSAPDEPADEALGPVQGRMSGLAPDR